MEELISKAKELGEMICAHSRYATLRDTELTISGNEKLSALIEEYHQAVGTVRNKEMQQQPIEPAEKKILAELQEKVSASPELQTLAKQQADYAELMNKIDAAIKEGLGVTDTDEKNEG